MQYGLAQANKVTMCVFQGLHPTSSITYLTL